MFMRSHVSLMFVVGLLAIGTLFGVDASTSPDVEGFEAHLGGPRGVHEFFKSSSKDEIRALVEAYGMKYFSGNATMSLLQLDECPQRFPTSLRASWHDFDGEEYYIDSRGRPSQAITSIPPVSTAPRSTSCQASVGQWGDSEDSPNDYDGGHLIASQLGGWGARLNLVPQLVNLNRGNWAQVENQAADCAELPSSQNGRVMFHSRAYYPTTSALVPHRFRIVLEDTGACSSSGSSVNINFDNEYQGGSDGIDEREEGVEFLESIGCGDSAPAPYCG